MTNALRAPEDVVTVEEYCQGCLDALAADGLTETYTEAVQAMEQCLARDQAILDQPEPHWAGQILSAALWQLREELGETVLHDLLVEGLGADSVNDTGDLRAALERADDALFAGVHRALIEEAFASRGIGQNLALGFPQLDYSTCD